MTACHGKGDGSLGSSFLRCPRLYFLVRTHSAGNFFRSSSLNFPAQQIQMFSRSFSPCTSTDTLFEFAVREEH